MQTNKMADIQALNIKKMMQMQITINELVGIIKQYKQKCSLQAT